MTTIINGQFGSYGVPLVEIDRRFTVHLIDALYTDVNKPGRDVPNPDDLIIDYVNNSMWRCVSTDYTNYTYEMINFNPVAEFNLDAEIGGCAPSESDTFRVYINSKLHPTSLLVDARLRFTGSANNSIRIFKGTDLSDAGTIISGYFTNDKLQSTFIPLELASITGNKTVKQAVAGICTGDVEDGELVTIVVYNNDGGVTCKARCYIVDTNVVLASESPSRQILDVKLKSAFISKSDSDLLLLPVNLPLDDIFLQAEIIYTDGSEVITVDGSRATLHGLRNSGSHDTYYISSNIGQTLPLTLSYRMSSNELYLGDNVVDSVINKSLAASTLEVDGSYSVKLFVVPRWISVTEGYRLEYYLYSLERGNVFYATPYVEISSNSAKFDPTLYGVKQRLVVKVDLSEVNAIYSAHIHPQSFHLTLLDAGNDNVDNFLIGYANDQPSYGTDARAIYEYSNTTYWKLDISCGASSKAEWLALLFYTIYPLYDIRTEDAVPEPTHVDVVLDSKTYTISVDNWMNSFNITDELDEGDVVMLRWIARTANDELQLGVSPMLAHQ